MKAQTIAEVCQIVLLFILLCVTLWDRLPHETRRKQCRCEHLRVRCIHGDEIIATGMMRGQCLDCGKWLKTLPVICSATGQPH